MVTSVNPDSGTTPIDRTLNGPPILCGEASLCGAFLAGASPVGHPWPSSFREASPFSLNYVKIWRIFSSTMMAWPREKHKGKESTFAVVLKALQLVLFSAVVIDIAAYAYKYQYEVDFTTKGQLYITVISGAITLMRSLVPTVKNYHEVADRLFNEVHLIHFKHKSEYHLKAHLAVRKLCTRWTPLTLSAAKFCRVNWCLETMERFTGGGSNAVFDPVIDDECWISL
ncbi:hypothetical protein EVAR_34681_1 [Eumeta japonica]|uniref:Uncharacterized protein n=1 Tax=Eumeta variegata TaxID=151549 RepID=A0A4C1VIB9_EUMVA|nr:hypothetical protein EVAR_34681_1 [Eumeta japonica]